MKRRPASKEWFQKVSFMDQKSTSIAYEDIGLQVCSLSKLGQGLLRHLLEMRVQLGELRCCTSEANEMKSINKQFWDFEVEL